MPTLNAFIESLTNEHDKLVQIGILISSKYQALFVGGPKASNAKGKQKKEKTKFYPPKQKEKNQQLDEPSGSRKNKQRGKGKTTCSYCARGFHLESSCMKRTIDQMALLLEKNNITLPEGTRKKDIADRNNQLERGHGLMANVSKARALLIDSGSLNHMVSCKDSFTSLYFGSCISIHMGDDSHIS